MSRLTLDHVEHERRVLQQALDRSRTPAVRNRRGQYATPPDLAVQMASLAKQHLPPTGSVRFLDPGLGTGVFFYAARKVLGHRRLRRGLGFETDPEIAAAAARLWKGFGLEVRNEDFCTASPSGAASNEADLILCNPPYVRHHHLSASRKARLRRELMKLGLPLSGLAGLYCYFLLLAHR